MKKFWLLPLLFLSGCGTMSVAPYVDGDAGRDLYVGVQIEWKY